MIERENLEVTNEKKNSLLCDCGGKEKKQDFCTVCSHFDIDLIP
jgi:hypothetical protein